MKPKAENHEKIDPVVIDRILEVHQGECQYWLLGTEPIVHNRLSEKARHELLMPGGRKTAVERQLVLKHEPYNEYRASPYRMPADTPTAIGILAASFKKALMAAALDLPGAKKAQIGRLVWVTGEVNRMYTPIYGVPQIMLAPVRSADINRTPDIRSRAVCPRWACHLTVRYVEPLIKEQAITRLMAAAGMYIGVGDWRKEKGSGTFGSFELRPPDDPEWHEVVEAGRREVQVAALEKPECYDLETLDLLTWFDAERNRRQMKGV